MVLSDLVKGGLESCVWIDEYNYQNKDKKERYEKYESVIFSVQCIIAKHVIPHSVIAAILTSLNFALNLRPSWTPS